MISKLRGYMNTQYALFAILLVLLIWDIVLAVSPPEHDTISAVLHNWGTKSWFVLVGIGAVLGHVFWSIEDGRVSLEEAREIFAAEEAEESPVEE